METLYAAWIDDAVDALMAVEKTANLTADQVPETLVVLSESSLLGLGMEEGDVKYVTTQT